MTDRRWSTFPYIALLYDPQNPFIERFNVDRKQPFIHLNTIFIASNIILHLFHYLAKPLLTVPNSI
ncbi:hypothetical protein [Candidatus Cyrtobacter comes]|uniref:hypothetical protein n=1 Tax=Candidatus Cyrtobacter comes TaxID=675776 RepID=UPI002ACEC0DB|nr:hypothetical protein [Candidatus Cyrtobacter comes]